MTKSRIKADFTPLLNQATLFGGDRSLLIPTWLPVISNRPPCYRITGRMAFKILISKENISNKLAEKGSKSFFFPVPSLFRADNREKPPFFEISPKSFDIRPRVWRSEESRDLTPQLRGDCRR